MEVFLRMGIVGSAMMAVMLAMRPRLLGRVPAAVPVLLWLLVAARLLIPVSLTGLLAGKQVIELGEVASAGRNPLLETPDRTLAAGDPGVLADGSEMGLPASVQGALLLVWGVGVVCCLLVHLAAALRLARMAKRARPVKEGPVAHWAGDARLVRVLRVKECPGVSSPLTYGILSPVILVPEGFADERPVRMRLMLEHELEHVRHFDSLWKLLFCLACCLHWFNPLVWKARDAFDRDLELARDAAVLRRLGDEGARAYANALLDVAERNMRAGVFAAGFASSSLHERVHAVMARGRTSLAVLATSAVLLSVPVLALATASVSTGATCRVQTDLYEFDVPEYWLGKVTVDFDGSTTTVRLADAPDVFLVKVQVVPVETRLARGHRDYALLECRTTSDGRRVEVWGLSPAGMSLGRAWRDMPISSPAYPGEKLEELAVDLQTGGERSAQEMWAMGEEEWGAMDAGRDGYAFYRAELLPTFRVTVPSTVALVAAG